MQIEKILGSDWRRFNPSTMATANRHGEARFGRPYQDAPRRQGPSSGPVVSMVGRQEEQRLCRRDRLNADA
jgi:hypothetical protein